MTRDCDRKKPWRATVKHNYKERFLGYFSTKEEAEEVERQMRLRLKGREEKHARVHRQDLAR